MICIMVVVLTLAVSVLGGREINLVVAITEVMSSILNAVNIEAFRFVMFSVDVCTSL